MKCSSCGHESAPDSRFCLECGAALMVHCTRCGAGVPATARFCNHCGAATEAAELAPERSPRAYTPRHLAEKILTSRSALEGERKQVTVLFADLKGSMDLGEQVDPEEWHKISKEVP